MAAVIKRRALAEYSKVIQVIIKGLSTVRQTRFNRGKLPNGEFAILTAKTSPDQEYFAQCN